MNNLNAQQVFAKQFGNADNYRIPSMVVTKHNTVIAVADERFYTARDNPNRIDKVVRRSTDSGVTWEGQTTAVQEVGESMLKASAAIDACLLYDDETDTVFMLYSHTPAGRFILNCYKGRGVDKSGRLIVLFGTTKFYINNGRIENKKGVDTGYFVSNNGDVTKDDKYICNIYINDGKFKEYPTAFLYLCKSTDDGKTWSEPVCLDNMVKEKYFTWLGAGPGIGIKIKEGKYKGRLIMPMYFNVVQTPLMLSNAMIYSDDQGKTWKRGKSPNDCRKRRFGIKMTHKFVLPQEMLTESQIIECGENKLRLFMRNHDKKRLVALADSYDGGHSWKDFRFHIQLDNCICQLSVLNVDYNGRPATMFLNAASKSKRENGVIRLSFDYGNTFPYSKVIKEGGFVYSCMCQLPDGEIGVLYEGSTEHETIDFIKFPIDWIME